MTAQWIVWGGCITASFAKCWFIVDKSRCNVDFSHVFSSFYFFCTAKRSHCSKTFIISIFCSSKSIHRAFSSNNKLFKCTFFLGFFPLCSREKKTLYELIYELELVSRLFFFFFAVTYIVRWFVEYSIRFRWRKTSYQTTTTTAKINELEYFVLHILYDQTID